MLHCSQCTVHFKGISVQSYSLGGGTDYVVSCSALCTTCFIIYSVRPFYMFAGTTKDKQFNHKTCKCNRTELSVFLVCVLHTKLSMCLQIQKYKECLFIKLFWLFIGWMATPGDQGSTHVLVTERWQATVNSGTFSLTLLAIDLAAHQCLLSCDYIQYSNTHIHRVRGSELSKSKHNQWTDIYAGEWRGKTEINEHFSNRIL